MKTIIATTIICLLSLHAFGQNLLTHIDERHGFRLNYPSDWIVKEAVTQATLFKAVKKFADNQYLMFTVNAQMLEQNASMTDYTVADLVDFACLAYGKENVTMLSSERGQIGNLPYIKLLLDTHPPAFPPRIEYSTFAINNHFFYTVTVSCNKPLYQQYADQIKQLANSFVFTAPEQPVQSLTQQSILSNTTTNNSIGTASKAYSIVPGEKPVPAFFKAFGTVWVKYLIIGLLLVVVSAVWTMMQPKQKFDSSSEESSKQPQPPPPAKDKPNDLSNTY